MKYQECLGCHNTFRILSFNHFYCGNCKVVICEICGDHEHIEYHHPKDRSIGGTETMPLCKSCHKTITAYHHKIRKRMMQVDYTPMIVASREEYEEHEVDDK